MKWCTTNLVVNQYIMSSIKAKKTNITITTGTTVDMMTSTIANKTNCTIPDMTTSTKIQMMTSSIANIMTCTQQKYRLAPQLITIAEFVQLIYSNLARIQRWALRLFDFNFKMMYRPDKSNLAEYITQKIRKSKSSTTFQLTLQCQILSTHSTVHSLCGANFDTLDINCAF